MNRRPWPIVLLAVLQFLSPLFYIITAAIYFGLTPGDAAKEVIALSTDLRKFEIFILPIILGVLVFLTKRTGYYLAIAGSIYLIIRSIIEFSASNQTDPVFPMIIMNVLSVAVLIYLLLPKTRDIYLNRRVRWWETDPRYLVSLSASVTRIGASPKKAEVVNLAVGGAGIETVETGFLKDEVVGLEFQHEGVAYQMKSKIAWEKPTGTGKQYLGVAWADDNSNANHSKIRRMIRSLKSKRTPTSRKTPPRTKA